jgi:hypothetical protein
MLGAGKEINDQCKIDGKYPRSPSNLSLDAMTEVILPRVCGAVRSGILKELANLLTKPQWKFIDSH